MAAVRRRDGRVSASTTALGCRVKSGWATAVLLAGPTAAPRVLDRRRIELSDPTVPESRQPYHAGFGTEQTDAAAVARLVRLVTRCARRSVAALVRRYHAAGHRPRSMGVVVGSVVDPASITNPHIRAHASEGRLFHTVLKEAARKSGVRPTVVLEREVYAAAARALRRPPHQIRRVVTELGRAVGGPWRAEEKTAAVAAWLVLARPGPRRWSS